MMRASCNGDANISPSLPEKRSRENRAPLSPLRTALIISVFFSILLICPTQASAQSQSLTIAQAPGGIAFIGTGPYLSQFGTMNALGIGTPAAGVNVIALTTGALYYTPYTLTGKVNGNHTITVSALIKTNFTHAAALVLESCPSSSACNTSGVFAPMSTATSVTVMPPTANNNQPVTVTAGLGILVPDNDGAGAFAGTDTASITLTLLDENNNKIATAEIDLTSPTGETVQSAVKLTLGTATGGLTISPSNDYAANYGNVNGLGIGPGAGLTTVSVSGGTVYSTPYLINPVFAEFSQTTATITAALTTNFAHPAVLQLDDASALTGPFTQLTTTPLTITSTAADRSSITRYLGLFVSNVSGAGAFTGSDTATITFTMTVP